MSLFLLLAASAALVPPAFTAKPCAAEFPAAARCGSVAVPENRGAPGGRVIALNIVIMPAVSAVPKLPPLFEIAGGPGLAVTGNAGFYATAGSGYRADRDIVLVDQRGTGGSAPLACPEFDAPDAANVPLYPPAAVARCRARLEAGADLSHYGTREAVADLDAVRVALGHDRIDLIALSYGTTVALRYMATYPRRVRAAALSGVVPAAAMPPRDHAPAADDAMTRLFARCARDAACHAAFDPEADLRRAVARLPAADPSLTPAIFAEKLRVLMYQADTARQIPWIVSRAAAGDLGPLRVATRSDGPSRYFEGMYLSVTCAESMAAMDYPAAVAAAKRTRFGDYRLRRQREACAAWPTGIRAPGHFKPVASNAAVLLISGGLDPVAPAAWAAAAMRTLPNARHLVIAESGHVIDGLSAIDTCYDPLVIAFLKSGDPAAIDASCLATMTAPPFTLVGSGG